MAAHLNGYIDPAALAFDIDGVVADTMAVFIRLAHERYGLTHLSKDHLRVYDIHQCLDLEQTVVDDLICLTLDDDHTLQIPPMPGASEVLTELAEHGPLRFVTARIWPESIICWLHQILPAVPREQIQVIATGAPEAKLGILKELGVEHFVEDRVDTCHMLARNNIRPLLFDQPWNRGVDSYPRVETWEQIRSCVATGEWKSE